MAPRGLLEWLMEAKVYAVEICGTVIFLVFVVVEATNAIRHIIESGRKVK